MKIRYNIGKTGPFHRLFPCRAKYYFGFSNKFLKYKNSSNVKSSQVKKKISSQKKKHLPISRIISNDSGSSRTILLVSVEIKFLWLSRPTFCCYPLLGLIILFFLSFLCLFYYFRYQVRGTFRVVIPVSCLWWTSNQCQWKKSNIIFYIYIRSIT